MTMTVDLSGLTAEGIAKLIASTEEAHPYLKANKVMVEAILGRIKQTSCFLPKKPTPLASSFAFLRTVLSLPDLDQRDFVFVLVAVGARIREHKITTRSTFKVFPFSVEMEGWTPFVVRSKEDADKIEFTLSDVFRLPKADVANVQSCTNRLIKNYELHVKAMELYREREGGKTYSQAKQAMPGMTNREYMQCLRILTEKGLNHPRQTSKLPSNVLSAANAKFINAEARRLGETSSRILNNIIDAYRLTRR